MKTPKRTAKRATQRKYSSWDLRRFQKLLDILLDVSDGLLIPLAYLEGMTVVAEGQRQNVASGSVASGRMVDELNYERKRLNEIEREFRDLLLTMTKERE